MRKITVGFVVQNYKKGKCIDSEFVASDEVTWENDLGEQIDPPKNEVYFPFEMVQPNVNLKVLKENPKSK